MQKQIEYKGAKVFYTIIGSGEPVMLIHGFAEDSDVWKHQIDFLKDTYQLIVPDMPGSGLSVVDRWSIRTPSEQLTVGNECLTVEWMADCIKSVLDKEEITNCTMIGHSMGGYVTLAFAEKYPQLLKKFGLFHSSSYPDNKEKIQARKKGIEFIKEHGAYLFLKQSIPNLFAPKFSKEHPGEITALIERGKSFTAEALIQYYEAMVHRPDRTAVLKNFSKPILFIIGKEDKAVSPKDSLEQCHLPPISYVHILETAAHMGMWEEKNKCNTAIQEFLQG